MAEVKPKLCIHGTCSPARGNNEPTEKEHHLKLNTSDLRKRWGPNTRRPIVCVHGWQDNINSFDTLIPLLSPDNSYLAIDLPGHGTSSHFPRGMSYRANEMVCTLRRIQEYFRWPKMTLIGHSLGSTLSYLFSAYFPDEVDVFVAIDLIKPVSWHPWRFMKMPDVIEKTLKHMNADPAKAPLYDKSDLIQKHMQGSDNSITEKSSEILLERGTLDLGGKFKLARDKRLTVVLSPAFSHRELVHMADRIKANVLFLKAQSSPYYDAKEDVEATMDRLKQKAKRFEYHILPGTHHMHLNTPEVCAPLINSFLERTVQDRK